jgi:tRNA (guanine-N7-)-methyltransferase
MGDVRSVHVSFQRVVGHLWSDCFSGIRCDSKVPPAGKLYNPNMESESDYGVPIPGEVLPSEQWAKTALKQLPPAPLEWTSLFGRQAPVVLDLGCGNGRFLISSALRRPELNHLGLDILPLVIRYATKRANQRGLHHARVAVCGAHEFLEQYVAPRSVAEIHLYHPQPYRDETLAYKRLVTPAFLALVHRALATDGLWVVQTDNAAYWKYLSKVAPALFELEELTETWPDAPAGRTRREIYARQHKMKVYKACCRPRRLPEAEVEATVRQLPLPEFQSAPPRRPKHSPRRRRR